MIEKKKIAFKKGSVVRYADTSESIAKLKKMGYKEIVPKTVDTKTNEAAVETDTETDEVDEKSAKAESSTKKSNLKSIKTEK